MKKECFNRTNSFDPDFIPFVSTNLHSNQNKFESPINSARTGQFFSSGTDRIHDGFKPITPLTPLKH